MLSTLILLLSLSFAAEVDDGYAKLAAGARDEARELFLKARKDDAQAAMASRGLALLALAGDTKAESALNGAKKEPSGKVGLGFLALSRALAATPVDPARLDEAGTLFSEATAADPSLALGWYGLAEVQVARGDDAAAVKPLAEARRLDPALPLAVACEKKLRARIMQDLASRAAKGTLTGPPVAPLDAAMHDELQTWIDAAIRTPGSTEAETMVGTFATLGTWLAAQKDPCGKAMLRLATGRMALRLDLRTERIAEIDAGFSELSTCSDAPLRQGAGWLARAELALVRGEPLSAIDLAGSAIKAAKEGRAVGLEADATLLLGRAQLLAGKTTEAAATAQQAEMLVGSPGLRTAKLAMLRADLDRKPLASAVADQLEKLGDDLGLTEALLTQAAGAIRSGEAGKALPLLLSAGDIAADTGSLLLQAEASRLTGETHLALGDPKRAREAFEAAFHTIDGHGLPVREAALLLDVGGAALKQGDTARAAEAAAEARRRYEAWAKGGNGERARAGARGVAASVLLLGQTRVAEGRVAEGLKVLDEARDRYESIRDVNGRATALVAAALADPEIEILQRAGVRLPPPPTTEDVAKLLPLYGVTRPPDAALAPALISLGQRLLAEGELGRALDLLHAGILGLPPEDDAGRAAALLAYADAAALSGRAPAALTALDVALRCTADPAGKARVQLAMGRIQASSGDARSQATLESAAAAAEKAVDPLTQGRAALELGRLQLGADPAGAATRFASAAVLLSETSDPAGHVEALAWKAVAIGSAPESELLDLVSRADATHDPGLQLLARLAGLRVSPTPSDAQIATLSAVPGLLDTLRQRRAPIPVLGLAGDPATSPELRGLAGWRSELLRAVALLGGAGRNDEAFRLLASLEGGASYDWIELHVRRAALSAARKDVVSADLARVALDDAFGRVEAVDLPSIPAEAAVILARRADAAQAELAASYRVLLPADQRDVKARSLAEVQKALGALDAHGTPHRILAFEAAGDGLLTAVIGAAGATFTYLPFSGTVTRTTLDRVSAALAAPPVPAVTAPAPAKGPKPAPGLAPADQALLTDLVALYANLLGPIASSLPADARLLVVGNDWGSRVPFGALLPEIPAGVADLSAMPWLIRSHPVSLVPTADWLGRPREPAAGEIGDPPSVGLLEGPDARAGQAEAVVAALGSRAKIARCSATDDTACKKGKGLSAWGEMARAEYDVLHLFGAGSAVSLPTPTTPETLVPARARHTLIYADLVVIPAGNPADPLALGRAVLASRARTTLGARWDAGSVSDRWWSSFYAGYADAAAGTSPDWKAELARSASLALLDAVEGTAHPYAHPYWWAGPVVLGMPD